MQLTHQPLSAAAHTTLSRRGGFTMLGFLRMLTCFQASLKQRAIGIAQEQSVGTTDLPRSRSIGAAFRNVPWLPAIETLVTLGLLRGVTIFPLGRSEPLSFALAACAVNALCTCC